MAVTPHPADEAIRARYRTDSDATIAEAIGKTRGWVEKRRRRLGLRKPQGVGDTTTKSVTADAIIPDTSRESIEVEESETVLRIASKSPRIKSAEELIAHRGIDLDRWRIVKRREKQYEGMMKNAADEPVVVPMYSVHIELAPDYEARNMDAMREAILTDIRDHAPRYPAQRPPLFPTDAPRYMLEVCIFDPHFGKYAWSGESGEDYDLHIAERRFMWALERLLQKASHNAIEQIVFPIGQDAIHADSSENTTTRGTRQDVDTRWFKVFRLTRLVYQRAFERCMEIAPVLGIVVPGNHGKHSELALGEVLDAHFHHTDRVQIIGGPRERKYHQYGKNMIGYTHGDTVKLDKLPMLMAVEEPQMWADTQYREIHTGHVHKAKQISFVGTDEVNGVRVRVCPSLSGTDAWHAQQGFVHGWKAAEAFLWARDGGLEDTYSANLGSYPTDQQAA